MPTTVPVEELRVGDWLLRLSLNRLERPGAIRHLEPRAAELLLCLAARAGRVVSKEEIVASVWEGRAVADSAITRVVADVRRALDDDAQRPRYIETIPKRGYRLIVPVEGAAAATARQARRARRQRRLAVLAGIPLALVTGWLVWRSWVGTAGKPPPASAEPSTPRIVVLPFEHLGAPGNEYFAAGMTEEITTRLASAAGLAVISRQSSLRYADSGKTAREIGRELEVAYLLEGSVRWDRVEGEPPRIRISVQLVRTADDVHLWAGNFGGALEDVFDIQIAVAEQVLRRLDVTLADSERSRLFAARTDDLDAYDHYLRGLAQLRHPDFWRSESVLRAIQAFRQAVEKDPRFASGHAALGGLSAAAYWLGLDRSGERLDTASAAVERALELDSQLPLAHFAAGHHEIARGERERAVAALRRAAEGLPNESEIFRALGVIYRSQGRWRESVRESERALALSPRDARIATSLGFTHSLLGEHPRADELYRRALELEPEQVSTYVVKTVNHWLQGDLEGARRALEAMPQSDDPSALLAWWQQEILEGHYEAALSRLERSPLELLEDYLHLVPKAQLVATTWDLMGRPELARPYWDAARGLLERRIAERPDDARARGSLAVVLAALGDAEEAERQGRAAVSLRPVSEDAVGGPVQIENLALARLLAGDHDGAIEQLELLLSAPSPSSPALLRLDPRWGALAEHAGFRLLTATPRSPAAAGRAAG